MSAISRLRRGHRVKVRIPRPHVNRAMSAACDMVTLSWASWPGLDGDGLQLGFSALNAMLSAALIARTVKALRRDYRQRMAVAISEMPSEDYGSARQSTKEERAARGMDSHEHGELYGIDDDGNPVWRPRNAFMALITMPPGAGKTSNLVISSILHRAMLGYSVVVPDVKADLAPMLARWLRKLGFEVWCINPAKLHLDRTGNVEVGLYQPIIDAVYAEKDQRQLALKLAADYAALHHPITTEEKNPYFAYGSKRVIVVAILICCYLDPADCTPTAVYRLLADPASLLSLCRKIQKYQNINGDDLVLEDLKREARNLLHRAANSAENFSSFLEGASQKFLSFAPSGMLGDYGAGAIHALSAIRDRQIIVFIMTPLSAMREFVDTISLINHGIVSAVKAKPDGHPVHIVGEEALNYRFADLVSDLETLRQFRVTVDLYIQSQAGLERHYGKTAAAAINAYADIRIYASLNDLSEAKHVAAMLSNATIQRQDISYRDTVKDVGIASREMARALMNEAEVLSMEKPYAWAFMNGTHPVRLKMLSYAQMAPFNEWVDPSPITGTRLHAETVVTINYAMKEKGDAA
jgi:type IV secretory pathway TraG/TraD family ATPase VirD4